MADITSDLSAEQRHVLPRKEGGGAYTFFIVDDSDFMINNLKRVILSFEGEVMDSAADGAIAVAKYAAFPVKPDIITMDLTMPNMGGLEAIKEILATNRAQKIVIVSALGHKESVQQAIILGAKHFVVKPFQRDNVYRVFRSILGLKTTIPGAEIES